MCPSDAHFDEAIADPNSNRGGMVRPMISPVKHGKKAKHFRSVKTLLKTYQKKNWHHTGDNYDPAKIKDIDDHLQFRHRLIFNELLKGSKGNIARVDVPATGVTLKRTAFQPRVKAAMKKSWLRAEDQDGTKKKNKEEVAKYAIDEELQEYHPKRVSGSLS